MEKTDVRTVETRRGELLRRAKELVADSKAEHMEDIAHWGEVAKMMDSIDEGMIVAAEMKAQEYPAAIRKLFIDNMTREVIHTKTRASRNAARAAKSDLKRAMRKRPVPKAVSVERRKVNGVS